jgi:DNA repair exonuclease SbcCD ATPase subunit
MSWERDEAARVEQAASTLRSAADDLERSMRSLRDRVADVHGRPNGWIGPPADNARNQVEDHLRRTQSERESLQGVAQSLQNRAAWLRQEADRKDAAARAHH